MNLPNKLTMIRMLLIPAMVAVYLAIGVIGASTYWILGVIFAVASLTDYFDGKIARKRNIVTTFGKFMDPLADKLLVMTALLILADNFKLMTNMWMPFWFPLVILARELIVTSIRLVAVGEGKIIAASNLGKYKTATTMFAIVWYFFAMPYDLVWINYIGWIIMGLALLLTIVSGLDYFLKNKKIICESI
ncbi:MAG: CDP-diacylglycerol--glycerol-3-phosphate 3-phosphatidyltransferase [Bacilli bacterium]|nr:CDP-diacylglycerol--glycerol-3-phosphate 3-phosphatidyltransferase [Bacilli bacterium]MBN2697146.1 CDP-diacylglycerol--glycerol-3-phosphate 3-phosphatidyltransferase [Bacilli bacterium]